MNYQFGGRDLVLLQYLEERLRKDPGSAFFAMLAYFYLSMDKVPEALSIAQRGVIVHPGYSTGHAVLAMALMRAGLYRDARKEILKAADLHPGSAMIESLREQVDKEEQADSIGRRIAEQYRKNSGTDIMKTVELTLKSNPIKTTDDDFLIPGLESIVGEDAAGPAPTIVKPIPPEEPPADVPETATKAERGDEEPLKPREIIDRVAREYEDKISVEPPERAGATGETEERIGDFDLDALARELNSAEPIRPESEPTQARAEDEGIELTPEIVTDTLAMIFEQQGQINTAIEAYNILLKKKPEQAEFYRKKIAELESKANERR